MEDDPVHAPEYRIVWASDVEARPVRWLWRERIPIGGLTLLVGRGGRGKSTIVVELAARLSNGQLDGDLKGEPVEVAYFSAEDGREFVLKPRITAAGADDYRVGFPELLDESGAPRPVTLPADVDLVRRVLGEMEVRLVVFDPVVAYLDRHVNSWKDQDVRRVLAPLAALAEDLDVAVAGVVHLTKSPTTDLIDRVGGSSGFANAARSVLAADYHPDHPDGKEHVLVHAKSNWGVHAPTLRYGDRKLAGTSKAKAAYRSRRPRSSGSAKTRRSPPRTCSSASIRRSAGRRRRRWSGSRPSWPTSARGEAYPDGSEERGHRGDDPQASEGSARRRVRQDPRVRRALDVAPPRRGSYLGEWIPFGTETEPKPQVGTEGGQREIKGVRDEAATKGIRPPFSRSPYLPR